MKEWNIELERDNLSWAGIGISVIFTTYGLSNFIDKLSAGDNLYFWGGVLGLILMFLAIEHQRTQSTVAYLNSKLDEMIDEYVRTKTLHYIFAIFITLAIFASDIFGAMAFKDRVGEMFVNYHLKNLNSYRGKLEDIDSGAEANKIWLEDKKHAQLVCDKAYPINTKPKGNNWCMNKWKKSNPKSNININKGDTVKLADIEAQKWAKTYQEIAFYFFIFLAMFAQFLALKRVLDDYEYLEYSIEDNPETYKTSYEHWKEVERTKLEESMRITADERVQELDMDLNTQKELSTIRIEAIANKGTAHILATSNQREKYNSLLYRNQNHINIVPQQNTQAIVSDTIREPIVGFKDNTVSQQDYQQKGNIHIDDEGSTNYINPTLFKNEEYKIVCMLFDGVSIGEALHTRDSILDVIGNNRLNTLLLTKIYNILKENDYVYRNIRYYAKATIS